MTISCITSEHLPGDTPWAKKARHESRVRAVWEAATEAASGDEALAGLLVWAEGHPAHPTCVCTPWGWATPPTTRPTWWTEAGLPDRRHRMSGDAWTAAARAAAQRHWSSTVSATVEAMISLGHTHQADPEMFPALDVAGVLAAILRNWLPAMSEARPDSSGQLGDPLDRICRAFKYTAGWHAELVASLSDDSEREAEAEGVASAS